MSTQDHERKGRLSRLASDEPGGLELLVGYERFRTDQVRPAALWIFGVAVLTLISSQIVGSSVPGFHWVALTGIAIAGFVAAPVLYVLGPRMPDAARLGLVLAAVVVFLVGVALAGPRFGEAAAAILAGQSTLWLYWSRRITMLFFVVAAVGYAVVVGTQPGYVQPVARWIFVVGLVALSIALGFWVFARVRAQFREIEGLNRLRRFLSPQVAEAVLRSEESSELSLLTPHRRQIAVVFCDLRGFTAFASGAEPEEVVEVLDGYYAVVGQLLQEHQATVGSFAGDGIMAYFNDPVPCEDPAGKAVRMAMQLREPMASVTASWSRRGFDLGYGVGIAYGYATLGTIGFELRSDYTAVGSVVNLAARLCGEARSGEILIDGRTQEAVQVDAERREVALKGFSSPVQAFVVSSVSG